MSGNLLGSAYRVMTFGESHGPFIGVVIDGLMPGLPVDVDEIQHQLDRRRPGQSSVTTPRNEADKVEIVSGIFQGKTTGTPLCMLIRNKDQRSADYGKLQDIFRPGHAAYTFLRKYGIFDYRGGGRASGRETATRVAAGAVARQLLSARGISIHGYSREIGGVRAETVDLDVVEQNMVRSPDPLAAEKMIAAINAARDDQDSIGGIVEVVVRNCPAGLGEPVFHKMEADLAAGLMSIGAIKGFEMGNGFQAARMKASENNDCFEFDASSQRFRTRTNFAGGVLGGITNGEDLVMRIAVKPPSSINKTQYTANHAGETVPFEVGGRHDPCICPRVVPVAEAVVALVLADHLLMQDRITENGSARIISDKIESIDTQICLLMTQRQALQAARHPADSPAETSPRETSVVESAAVAALPLSPEVLAGLKNMLK